jgi:dTMP kinase
VTTGRLLVFEGPEGAGKSTQIARLGELLAASECPHLIVREPGGTPVGEHIRALLLDPSGDLVPAAETLLFLASRAELVARVISPALQAGRLVIVDRFFLSTYAYQIAGRRLSEDTVRAANRLAIGDLRPDLTLLLSHHATAGLARADRRGARDRIERADDAFHERVGTAFTRFSTDAWQRDHPEAGPIVSIDASAAPDAVFEEVVGVLAERWPETFRVARGSDRR